MKMIKTGYASDFKKGHPRPPDSGTVILITRGEPFPWLDYDEWIQDLGPEWEIWNRWWYSQRTEKNWKIYEEDYYPQMKRQPGSKAIEELGQRSKNGEIITLICYCKEGEHCHRYIVKLLIEESLLQ